MKIEHHPFGEFIPVNPRSMIIGSFPIGKFSDPSRKNEIRPHELKFFFGGEKNLLWKLIGAARRCRVSSVAEITLMLEEMGLGVGDVIRSCRRKNGGASDTDLFDITFNTELLNVIRKHNIRTLYFTSRKVEAWFNRLFPESADLQKISLISPSSQTLRAIGKNADYLRWKEAHPSRRALEFLYEHYALIFSDTRGDSREE